MAPNDKQTGDNAKGSGGDVPSEKSAEEMVLYDVIEPHIAQITLNRPERGNAILTPDMNVEIARKMTIAEDDDTIKVVIIAGNGKHFCSGEDNRRMPIETFGLKKGQRLPQSLRMRGVARGHQLMRNWFLYSSKTTVAACQGAVLGAGFGMIMTCDLVVAAEDAYFARRQSRIGFAGFDVQLPLTLLRCGINHGYEMNITGRTVSAQEMKDWGVVCSLVPPDKLMDEALRYARAVAAHSTDNLMLGRHSMQMFWDLMGMSNYANYVKVAHPLFTNMVWRDDEMNWFRERNKHGNKEGMKRLNKVWEDLGFE